MKEKLFKYFEELYRSSRKDKIISIIKKILEIDGKDKIINDLCDSFNFYNNKEYDEGKNISTKHDLYEFNILSGMFYYELKRYEDAEKYYKIAVEKEETFSYSYYGLGSVYLNLKRYDDAEKYFKIAIEKEEDLSGPYNGLGNVNIELKKYQDAEKLYKLAIEKDSTYQAPYYNLGNLYLDISKYDEAEKYYKTAIEKDESYAPSYNNLGVLYDRTGKNSEAERCYMLAIEKDNSYTLPYNNLGVLYNKMGKYIEAEKYYRIALNKDDNDLLVYRNLIRLFVKLKKKDEDIVQNFKNIIKGKETDDDLYLIGKIENKAVKKEIKDKFQVEEKIEETNKNKTKGIIIFIDLCGSTAFKSKKENIWFDRLIHFYKTTENHLREILKEYNSNIFLLKYIGDEIMFYIEDNDKVKYYNDCIFKKTFIEFIRTLRDKLNTQYFLGRKKNSEGEKENEKEMISFEKNDDRIDLKMCIAYVDDILRYEFEDTCKGFDILGTSVDFTSRIMELCKENMILCNYDFYSMYFDSNFDENFIELGKFDLHGITDKYEKNQTIYLYDYNNIINKINKLYLARIKSKIFDELIGRLLLLDIYKK